MANIIIYLCLVPKISVQAKNFFEGLPQYLITWISSCDLLDSKSLYLEEKRKEDEITYRGLEIRQGEVTAMGGFDSNVLY